MTKAARGKRTPVNIRLSPEGVAEVDELAGEDFKGNRSAAVKRCLQLGIQEYRRLKRLGKHDV